MKSNKNNRRSLFYSVISLLLCISMLLGTTLAWFSDSVSSTGNIIKTGRLKVAMHYADDLSGEWKDASEATIFNGNYWEPGFSDMKYIKVSNTGNLAFSYQMHILPAVQAAAGDVNLADVIDVYVGVVDADFTAPAAFSTDMPGLGKMGTLAEVMAAEPMTGILLPEKGASGVLPEGVTADTGDVTYCVVLHMQETAGNEYQNLTVGNNFTIQLVATQYSYEQDNFGGSYDAGSEYPDLKFPEMMDMDMGSAEISVDSENKLTQAVTLKGTAISANVPVGVLVKEDTTKLTLTVEVMDDTTSNITLGEGEEMRSLNVHVSGVSEENTVPMIISLGEVAPEYLNQGNLNLAHVENGVTVPMTRVETLEELDAHNEYYYDVLTGELTVAMATFSEVAVVADMPNAWNGEFDYSWYDDSKTNLTIANADQLAAFGAIVGGMNGQTQDSFTGETVKLLADIDLGDAEEKNVANKIFYPIGYYYTDDKNADGTTGDYYSTVNSFEGTFDGNGHTIANFYQNTWEIKGDYDANYYKDGMGLFGYVVNGKVCNLTVDNFSSDGEFTPTGVIAAYAVNSTFENIAITNCNPRVYNTGNGGIVGIGGSASDDASKTLIFNNITIDNTNKISALWGSWDVACGGLMGMFRGPEGAEKASRIEMTNCHVAAQIDVNNDVCGNYQYYWYRYSGMMIGTIDYQKTEGGYTVPITDMITASGCTVHFGDWNDYYYCELVDNTLASYTHDHQMSRLTEVKAVNGTTITYLDGTIGTVPTSGRANYVVVNGDEGTENATCYHFKNGEVWTHGMGGAETSVDVNGDGVIDENDIKEDKQHIYLPFNQLFTGYGWGVKHVPIHDGVEGITVMGKYNVQKFEKNEALSGDFLYRVGNGNAFPVGKLFQEVSEGIAVDTGVHVSVTSLVEGVDMVGTFVKNESDWTQSTLHITGGTGPAKLTIQDYNRCEPFELIVEVVDAENATSAYGATDKDIVLLDNVSFSSSYLYYKNMTLYGNGFTIDITEADHNDLKDTSDTSSNKSAYCNIWLVDSIFNNVQVKGSVYPKVGMTADSDYGNAAIRTEGDCYIVNSYISNCRVPLRVQGNTTLVDTVVDGGRYANIELRFGKLTLDGVTTINTVRKGSDGTTDVIGFGIVIHAETANASISVIGDGLKQYNWAGENKHKSVLSGDTYLSQAYGLIFAANNDDAIYFDYSDDRYVSTGILCLSADLDSNIVTGLDDRYIQEVSAYDAWVMTYDNSKHTEWFNASVATESIAYAPDQYPVIPKYSGNEAQTVEFTKGETYYFDTSVLSAEKAGHDLSVSSVTMNGTAYNYGDKIAISEGGVYDIVYAVVDPYNYNADASATTTVTHNISVTLTAIAKDAAILAPKFTFIDQNGNKYEATTVKAGDKTYVMPNVTAADPTTNSMSSINIGSTTISGTTVYFPVATGYTVRSGSNFNRYYPLFNGINITDYTVAGDTTGTTYTTSGNYTSLVGSSGTKFIIPANGGQTNCGDYVKTDGQSGNAAGNSDSGWQGAGYNTEYGGTYLKSGNTNASSGADSNGFERIVWVEYCFNAGNGDVYYYRIGYHCNKESAQSCITEGTLITMADGTQKPVENLNLGDMVLAFNHISGKFEATPVIFNSHVDDLEPKECDVLYLEFSNGEELEIVESHGLFDMTLMKYVYLDNENYNDFIGHQFFYAGNDGTSSDHITLENAYIETEVTRVFCPVTYFNMNSIANGFLNAPNSPYGIAGPVNYFDYDPDLKYNEEAMKRDIEKYGLYTYDDFRDYISEEAYNSSTAVFLKVAEGKGLITFEEILIVINYLLEGSLIN